jgi:hypothetical protein
MVILKLLVYLLRIEVMFMITDNGVSAIGLDFTFKNSINKLLLLREKCYVINCCGVIRFIKDVSHILGYRRSIERTVPDIMVSSFKTGNNEGSFLMARRNIATGE